MDYDDEVQNRNDTGVNDKDPDFEVAESDDDRPDPELNIIK